MYLCWPSAWLEELEQLVLISIDKNQTRTRFDF